MFSKVSVGFALLLVALCSSGCTARDVDQVSRQRRDTGEWVRQSIDAPFLQDFGNGTVNNATGNVWKKCVCDMNACQCYAQYQDFNSPKLLFSVEHIKTHPRFRVIFREENSTNSQTFVLMNGTSCFQFSGRFFDQVCFLRYGWEVNQILDKACVALGVRIQRYSSVAVDYECVKHMSDGTTHVGPLNMTSPDLNFLSNYTLYGSASANALSTLVLLASTLTAVLISKISS